MSAQWCTSNNPVGLLRAKRIGDNCGRSLGGCCLKPALCRVGQVEDCRDHLDRHLVAAIQQEKAKFRIGCLDVGAIPVGDLKLGRCCRSLQANPTLPKPKLRVDLIRTRVLCMCFERQQECRSCSEGC